MKTKIYNKLVRDRIPEIIETDGKTSIPEMLAQAVASGRWGWINSCSLKGYF